MTLVLDPPAAGSPVAGSPVAGSPASGSSAGGGPPGHPVLRFVASMDRALDGLSNVPAWSMSAEEQRAALVGLRRERARLAELELRVLVAADRDQVGRDAGATSTAAWLADATGSTRAGCFRDLHLAQALDGPFEATRRALAAGLIDVERATVVVH